MQWLFKFLFVPSLFLFTRVIFGSSTYIYVTDDLANTVSVVQESTNMVVATVGVGSRPEDIAITPDENYVYVVNAFETTVSVIQTSDWTLYTTITGFGSNTRCIAITPNGKYAYVGCTSEVEVVEISTNTIAATLPIAGANSIAITPNSQYAYITLNAGQVSVLRLSDNSVVTSVNVGNTPLGSAVTPDGNYLYVANNSDSTVSVIQTSDNSVIATIGVQPFPIGVAITLDGSYAYVTSGSSSNLTVIETNTNTVFTTVNMGISRGTGVAMTPDGLYAYVTINQATDNLKLIQLSDNTVISSISAGNRAHGVAIIPLPPQPPPPPPPPPPPSPVSTPESTKGFIDQITPNNPGMRL